MRINDALRRGVRVEVEGRENVEATGGVIDTQSAKRSMAGGPERGFDGGKKVYGRKRHLRTDPLGLLITACGHSAQRYDGARAKEVFAPTKARGITLKKVWADQTYRGALGAWMAENGMGTLEIVERLPGQRGFVVQPKRWVVERTHSESWLYLASIRLLVCRRTKAA